MARKKEQLHKRRYVLRRREGSKALLVALHGFRQIPDRPNKLPGRLGLPFEEFTGFNDFPVPVDVCYPVAWRRNWRTRQLGDQYSNPDAQFIDHCITECRRITGHHLVYMFGFSDGGTMAHIYNACWGRDLAGLCVASGWVPNLPAAELQSADTCRYVLLSAGDSGRVEKAASYQAEKAFEIYQDHVAVALINRPGSAHNWDPAWNAEIAQRWGVGS